MDKEQRKKLREKRTRKYFIEAACKIIEDKGLENLSVRKVADIAGYHFSTLYSYFQDINDVKLHAAIKFLDDIYRYIQNQIKSENFDCPLEKYIYIRKTVAYWSLEHPDAYQLINFENLGKDLEKIYKNFFKTPASELEISSFKESIAPLNLNDDRGTLLHDLILSLYYTYFRTYINQRIQVEREDFINSYLNHIRELFKIFSGN